MLVKTFFIRLDKIHLQEDEARVNDFMKGVMVKKTATQFVNGPPPFWSMLVYYDITTATEAPINYKKSELTANRNSGKIVVTDLCELTEQEQLIFEGLKRWRQELAEKKCVPCFFICHNTQLMSIAKVRPRSASELAEIKGFSEWKANKYAPMLLPALEKIIEHNEMPVRL